MHSRRLACLLLGMWLAGSFLMTWVASDNVQSVERFLANQSPAATLRLKSLGSPEARPLLRYAAEELNRKQMVTWQNFQLFYLCGFFFFLLFGTAEGKIPLALGLLILGIVAFQRLILSPEVIAEGRLADFSHSAAALSSFQAVQNVAAGVEIFKWIAGAILAAVLLTRLPRRSAEFGQKVNLVNKADHRHVDW